MKATENNVGSHYFKITNKHGESRVALMSYSECEWYCLLNDCEWELIG